MSNEMDIHMKYMAERFDRIETRIEGVCCEVKKLQRDGCAVGTVNTRDIAELRQSSGGARSGAFAGGFVSAVVAGIAGVISYFVGAK